LRFFLQRCGGLYGAGLEEESEDIFNKRMMFGRVGIDGVLDNNQG
jgi:hypothetical protein